MSRIAATHTRRIIEAIDAMTVDQLAAFEHQLFCAAWRSGLDLTKSPANDQARATYQLYEGPFMVAGNVSTGWGLSLPEVVVCLAAYRVEREVFDYADASEVDAIHAAATR